MPLARIIVFALALTQAVGLAVLVMDDSCEEVCSDDGCTDCVPGVACRCHGPSAMPLPGQSMQPATKVNPPRNQIPGFAEQRMHASPDPREILHVPKHAA